MRTTVETCRRGHPWTPENTCVVPSDGGRRCRTCKREPDRRYRQAIKLEALNRYGGPVCAECGEEDVEKLSLDHANGDGGKHRRRLGLGSSAGSQAGYVFYLKLRQLGWPNDPPLQVLCRSCNTAKANRGRKAA